MNRIDRLTAILLLLQGRKRTAGEIAQRFEISRRTVLRDMQALSEMGIPIVADAGASGGYTLPPDYSLPPLALTLHEALLLRLAIGGLAHLTETPYKDERESLLAKVDTLLPRHARARLDQDQQILSIDIPSRPYPTPFLDRLVESAREKRWIRVRYRSENGGSWQTLLPSRLRTTNGLWYCEAYSSERQETRIYRVDRIVDVRGALPPLDAANRGDGISHVDPAFPEVRIVLTARGVLRLEREQHLAKHIQPMEAGGGQIRLCLRPAEYDWLVRILLDLGTEARVDAPEALRRTLRQAAQTILEHYTEW
jgi:predicted DNA-binding transcriptional regulator YafY